MTQATAQPHGKMVSADDYCASYDPQAGFERVCSLARQRRNLDFLHQHRPRRVLEVGCGTMMLGRMAQEAGLDFALWAIVEPASAFAAAARAAFAGDARFHVVQDYLEAGGPALRQLAPDGFDAVLLSGLLHETLAPEALLRAGVEQLAPGGALLASVPNALSFHRLLAVEAGLAPTPHTLSARDRALGHPVVFDRQGFMALMAGAGLEGLTCDGYLFKPFTNAQMERLLDADPEAPAARLVDGLIRLGRQFPDHAAELCITGTRPREQAAIALKGQAG